MKNWLKKMYGEWYIFRCYREEGMTFKQWRNSRWVGDQFRNPTKMGKLKTYGIVHGKNRKQVIENIKKNFPETKVEDWRIMTSAEFCFVLDKNKK